MDKRQLAKITIKSFDLTKDEKIRLIEFLTICMYHTDNNQKSNDIQNTIWYLQDKIKG